MRRLFSAVLLLISVSFSSYADTVKGQIADSDGIAVGGARVTFYSRQPQFRKTFNAGRDGNFTAEGIPSGYYNIEIAAKGFCMEYVTRYEVNEAKYGVASPVFRIFRPGSVSGYVYDENNNPLPGIKVNNAVTNSRGFYTISWLRPGQQSITAKSPGRVRTSQRVTVKEKKNTGGINFTLCEGGAVSGKVVSKETGKPLKNVRINIWGDSYSHTNTNSNGAFLIEGVAEGRYEMGTYLQGYEYVSVSDITVKKKENLKVPAIKMAMRPESFNLYDRNRVFTESENVFLLYNSFRVTKCSVSVFSIDLEEEMEKLPQDVKARKSGGNIRQAVNFFDIENREAVYKKDFEIRYPSPLSDIYDRKLEIGRLPAGVYAATVKPENLPEQRHLLTVTGLALVSRTDENKTFIYACDINTGKPVSRARISLLDRNLAVTGRGVTDKNGLFEVTGRYHRLIASKGSSLAYLGENHHAIDTKRIKTYIYTDRPVYRPGQVVSFKGIEREETGNSYKLAGRKKAAVTVNDPQGNIFHRADLEISPAGTFHGSFILPEEPPLGIYAVSSGQDSCRFKVLEYRKPEYSVKITTDKKRYLPREKMAAVVQAEYYFGAPLAEAEVNYSVYERASSPYYYGDYEYEDGYSYGWGYGAQVLAGNTATDDEGKALIEIPLKDSYDGESVYTVEARVVDSSRREVKAAGSATVVPGTFRIRISTEKYIYRPGEEMPVNIHVTDYENRPVAGKSLDFSAGLETYENRKVSFSELMKKNIVTDRAGMASVKIKPDRAGHTKIFIQGKDEHNNLITGSRYVWITGKGHSFSWSGRRQIELVLDRERYKEGDTVTVLVNSAVADMPLLFSLERSKIYRQEIVTLEGNTGLFEFRIEREHIPNVYITVTGVHGKKYYTSSRVINISPEEYLLDVTVRSDREKYMPGEKASYEIETRDSRGNPTSAEISFGLVDESIYAVSAELVPGIEDFFYGRKPNRIGSSYSFYEWLYAGAGKDGLDDAVRRDFKDTAYWNPHIMTDGSGRASLEVVLPDNLTTWRATARGATPDTKVGTAVHKVISSKPLIARLLTPRFLVEDDRLFITGIVHNYTPENLSLNINLSAKGIEILDAPARKEKVPAGGECRVNWQVKAGNAEKAVMELSASSGSSADAMELTIPVLTYGQEVFQAKSGEVAPLSSDSFFIPAAVVPHTVKLKTFIYPSLASGLFRNLDYLAKYPYGCVEQTMSRFIPLVYVAGALREIGMEDLSFLADDAGKFEKMLREMPEMVRTGLSRLYGSQNGDGGWGWWSRDTSRPYTSAYVLYGLSLARNAGYDVDGEKIKRAGNFLKGILKDIMDPDEKTYALFALAQAGMAEKKEVEEIYMERTEINSYSLALLTLIYAQMKETGRAAGLLEELYSRKSDLTRTMHFWKTEKPGRYSWINNDIEATAWALKATLAVAPERKEIPGIVRYLVWREKAGYWRSTKDTAICVLAFADFLRTRDELSPDYTISLAVNGNPVADTKVTRETLKQFPVVTQTPVSRLNTGKENTLRLSKEGEGAAYYTHNLNYFTRDSFIEAREEGFRVEREYFRITKEMNEQGVYTEKKEKLKGPVRVGDMIMAEVSVAGKDAYQYIMVEDMLPAGCEVVDEESRGWYARREIRDEKAAFFSVSFEGETRVFTYLMRAETPGSYHVLPARASMMYLPEIWGQSSENTLTIKE